MLNELSGTASEADKYCYGLPLYPGEIEGLIQIVKRYTNKEK